VYDIRQFRPTFYLVLILALGGYGIALESLPHFLAGVLLAMLYALLVFRGVTFLIPRLVASALAVLSGVWNLLGLVLGTTSPMLAISQWLFMLVLITLYSRRDNRAYGQMLVMSLVLMVAGAVNSASFLFGIILILYLFTALYSCLLFHLKVESEHATRAYNLTGSQALSGSLRHDQRHFNRSMRRLATLVCSVAVTSGLLVFLLFPRSHVSAAFAMAAQGRQGTSLTGFSERMGFDQIAKITQNDEVIADVSLSENGNPLPPSDIYLRGMTLDVYTGGSKPPSRQHDYQWIRSTESRERPVQYHLAPGQWQSLTSTRGARQIHQTVLLQPTGTSTLFALNGISSIAADAGSDVRYFTTDGSLRVSDLSHAALRYDAISTGEPPPPLPLRMSDPESRLSRLASSRIDPAIATYASRPDVSGSDANGSFAVQRDKNSAVPTALDEKIAAAICHHLQSDFKYTLDLTDIVRDPSKDPLVQFLNDFKRGHCEYFAGAMTVMCQSLGLTARVVIGFHAAADDYNAVGGYYVIRQSHAHAWVEVLTPQGWKSFDPTTGNSSYTPPTIRGMFGPFADFFDYLQYKWASSVVIYDNRNTSVIDNVRSGISASLEHGHRMLDSAQQYMHSEQGLRASARILVAVIIILATGLLLTIAIYLIARRRLNLRAQRIGLGALPSQDRLRLARQLRFYDDLLQLLARQRIGRPPHLTPREFAGSLGFLPSEVYTKVGQITEVFYRVRYGDQPLATHELHQVDSVIADIDAKLSVQRPRA